MPELSIEPANEGDASSSAARGRIIVVVASLGEALGGELGKELGKDGVRDEALIAAVTDSTARPITVVENFYEAIGELATTKMREAPDAVIAAAGTFGSRVQEFSLALRKADPAVTILAVAESADAAAGEEVSDLAKYVDAVLTLPLSRLELERAIQTADMVARQPIRLDDAHDDDDNDAAAVDDATNDDDDVDDDVDVVESSVEEAVIDSNGAAGKLPEIYEDALAEAEVSSDVVGDRSSADRDLLEQLLQSPTLPAVGAALELQLMSFYRDVDVRIVFDGGGIEEAGATPILYQGQLLAFLVAEKLDEAARQTHADWAAAYLAMAQQLMTYREMAYTDELTGAHNRRYFNLVLAEAIQTARPRRECVTLLLFDIDNFKKFNDEFGHPAGDRILTETVQLLRSVIRPTDQVCRMGGDEFAVIFFDAAGSRTPGSHHPHDIMEIARRFQAQIAEQRFPELGQKAPGRLTISGGLATFPWDAHDAASLYEFADSAALAAKHSGKNVITFGPPE